MWICYQLHSLLIHWAFFFRSEIYAQFCCRVIFGVLTLCDIDCITFLEETSQTLASTEVWAISFLSPCAHKHTVFAITCSQNEFGYRKSLIHIYWQIWLTGTKTQQKESAKVTQWVVQRKIDIMCQVQKKKYQERTVYLHYTVFNSMSKV